MIKNDSVIDPLHEPVLPKWATTLGQTHHSATQLLMSDGPHFFRYYVLTQQERRMIPGNAQMKAGVAVGDALQDYYADTKWSLNPITKKLMPYANAKKGTEKSQIIKMDLVYNLKGGYIKIYPLIVLATRKGVMDGL